MKRFSLSILLFLILFRALRICAQQNERDPAKEEPLVSELLGIAPEAVDPFVAATRALDSDDYPEAARLYGEVLAAAPEFEPAIRRRGYALAALGDKAGGLELTGKALEMNRTVDNLVGHAVTLLSQTAPEMAPSHSETTEALDLAREAWAMSGETDEDSASIMAETMLMLDDMAGFERFVPVFRQKLPDSLAAGYYNAIMLANQGNFGDAEAEIDRIRALGFPDEAAAPLLAAIEQAGDESYFGLGRFFKYLNIFFILIAAWALGLAGLYFIGRSLSKRTLKVIEESDPNELAGDSHENLRKLYRKIIAVASVYYYLSQPVVILIVIVATLAIFVFFLWIGRIPIQISIGLAFVALATIFYMVKSWVTRVKIEDPGRALSESEAPGLWKLVRDVAETIKTRPVNEIRITHGTDLAVYERGSFRTKLSDKADRILILGAAALNHFDQNAFRAVIAHEYGHFSNRDTAGGEIALRVNIDIERIATSMINSGTATVYNIGFQFLRLFHFLFRRITHGATRLQEVLADRVAAHYFGAEVFRKGLNHVVRRDFEFNKIADIEVNAALTANRAVSNLYDMNISEESARKQIDEEFAAYMDRPTTDDDTHPSPKDRFRYIENVKMAQGEPLNGEVWDLFVDRDAITREMSEIIDKLVRSHQSSGDHSVLGI